MPGLTKVKQWTASLDWPGIARILVIQVIVLVVLSLAVTRYLLWTSDMAQAEFSRAIEQVAPSAPAPVQRSDQRSDQRLAVASRRPLCSKLISD
jgi:flagellar basal body-associated protein FliL